MKPNLPKIQIFNAVSMGASATSEVVPIADFDNIGIQLNFTGTPEGTFAVQASADYQEDYLGNILNAGNWVSLSLPSTPTASGSPDQIAIDINQISFHYIRVVYTRSSSTGTLNGYLVGKFL